jgi:hypothetical protein
MGKPKDKLEIEVMRLPPEGRNSRIDSLRVLKVRRWVIMKRSGSRRLPATSRVAPAVKESTSNQSITEMPVAGSSLRRVWKGWLDRPRSL